MRGMREVRVNADKRKVHMQKREEGQGVRAAGFKAE